MTAIEFIAATQSCLRMALPSVVSITLISIIIDLCHVRGGCIYDSFSYDVLMTSYFCDNAQHLTFVLLVRSEQPKPFEEIE